MKATFSGQSCTHMLIHTSTHSFMPSKQFPTLFLFTLLSIPLLAQDKYFQQEVNTKIEVTLNDIDHTVTGSIEIEYINNSPDELNEIYMHLWANAFKDRTSVFAKQKIVQGNSKFFFAKDKDLGRYEDLDFKINGQATEWNLLENQSDIALVKLPSPLKSGARITITTPLNLKIPASFSRLGHVDQSYQMTQWFPKPAVYDLDGWHPMSYVDMGEFYSEFGSYDVKITLPENYVVGSTGALQNESENKFLQQRVDETKRFLEKTNDEILQSLKDTFPASSSVTKTLHFIAKDVHDFAWFADKRFYVQKSEVKMPSGKSIDTWAMFTNAESWLWRQGVFYVDRAVTFYSDKVGEYPYPHATAVQSALSAGGGMEYPMITVIGLMGDPKSLDGVITHEVGHNWFYGILAFDEREHPWMDEGLNSYYDHRYTTEFYEDADMEFLPKFLTKGSDLSTLELAYLYQARRNLDQAPETHSEDFGLMNYFLGGYEKPAVCFKWLEQYLGTPKFDDIMQAFYQEWKFRHPQPQDLRRFFTARTDKNLDWFFDGLIGSNDKTDYAIADLKKNESSYKVTVKNKGQLNTPFPISAIKDDSIVSTQWYDGFTGKQTLDFPKGDYDALVIDEENLTLDVYRKNNKIRTSGLLPKMPPLKLQFLASIENPERTQLFYTPIIGYNEYDKFMLGLGLYNTTIPAKRFEFALAPLYSFETKNLNGVGTVKYNLYPESNAFRKVTLGLGAKRFTSDYNEQDDYNVGYSRITPSLDIDLDSKFNTAFSHSTHVRALFITEELGTYPITIDSIKIDPITMELDTTYKAVYSGNIKDNSRIYQLYYVGQNTRAVNPYSYKIGLEQQSYTDGFDRSQKYLRATLELNTAYTYAEDKNVTFRFFIGYLAQNTRRSAGNVSNRGTRGSFALAHQGYNDYKYDYFHFGRNENEDIWSQQINMEEGGMKNAFGSAFSDGQSNDFIFAINFKGDLPQDLPLKLPVKPYFDIGYFSNKQPIASDASFSDQLWWSGGVMLDYKGVASIHFPLFNSKNLKTLYDQRDGGNYKARITWRLDLNKLNPFEVVNNFNP
jgi:Peptidase family M1 domain